MDFGRSLEDIGVGVLRRWSGSLGDSIGLEVLYLFYCGFSFLVSCEGFGLGVSFFVVFLLV